MAVGRRQTKLRTFRDVVRSQGRTLVWLAEQTGYSAEHVQRVARGDHPGAASFHKAMERVLGESYDWPSGVRRNKEAA